MFNRSMTRRTSDPALHGRADAFNGDEVEQSVALQQRLTSEALEYRNSVMQILFPSEMTKEVSTVEREIVVAQYRTKQEVLRLLTDGGLIRLQAALDQVVTNGVADSRADTSSRLLACREELEANLTASWRRFCEAAVEETQWATTLPPALQKFALQKVEASLDGFYRMMTAMLREFEQLVHQHVGER